MLRLRDGFWGRHALILLSIVRGCGALGCAGDADSGAGDAGLVPTGSTAASTAVLRNVDVTVVFPLPQPNEWDTLLRPTDQARGGALFGRDVFANGSVPELDEREPLGDDTARLDSLRAVAVRFDPCPGVMPPADRAACQPQIRLIFQSLRVDRNRSSARDGALHAFYNLSSDDFDAVLGELRQIRAEHASDPPVPLGIQPIAQREGLRGAYATRLRALVTRFCGEPNLVRLTNFRRLAGAQVRWDFAIRELAEGAWRDRDIATTGRPLESLVTIAGGRWAAEITPAVSHPDDPTRFLRASTTEEASAFASVVRLLNPRIHSSESVDCASCHIAPDVAQFGSSVRQLSLTNYADRFTSSYPLDVAARSDSEAIAFENVHMMSYLGESFSVSPRVASETAAILEFLERR